jgi:hypothetical protein
MWFAKPASSQQALSSTNFNAERGFQITKYYYTYGTEGLEMPTVSFHECMFFSYMKVLELILIPISKRQN